VRIAAWSCFWLHTALLAMGMFGLLSAVPHPEQFAGNAPAMAFYGWAIANLGTADILSGALAMLLFGIYAIGWQKTALFAAIATVLSATAELTGTATGWPFGGYEYTHQLGWQILGRVPYTVPLSWFYMGFAAYLVATKIAQPQPAFTAATRTRTVVAVILGAWLLTAWDLALDPAMASPQLNYMHFWVWHETGPYYGMPLRNLAGWFATGILFIGAGRLAWRRGIDATRLEVAFPFGIYAVNVIWAMGLSISVGEWPTAMLTTLLALVPAALSLRGTPIARLTKPAKAA